MNNQQPVNIDKLREQIEYAKKMKKAQEEFMTCMDKNCKKVAVNYNSIMQNTKNKFKKLLENYHSNKINEKELLLNIITILKNNMNNIKYTNYMKCLLKNCYKNYKLYIDLTFMSLNNDFVQNFVLLKAKEFNVDKDVKKFLRSIKNQSTMNKIKISGNLLISIFLK